MRMGEVEGQKRKGRLRDRGEWRRLRDRIERGRLGTDEKG